MTMTTLAACAVGLIATLMLAALLTPAHWWRRPNLRAITIVALGTWGIASLLLSFLAPGAGTPLIAEIKSYRVHQDLNLRAATSTAAPRIAVVPAGSLVTSTGLRDGDWWQVSARVDGKEVRGWSSSLWLRRADERRVN